MHDVKRATISNASIGFRSVAFVHLELGAAARGCGGGREREQFEAPAVQHVRVHVYVRVHLRASVVRCTCTFIPNSTYMYCRCMITTCVNDSSAA